MNRSTSKDSWPTGQDFFDAVDNGSTNHRSIENSTCGLIGEKCGKMMKTSKVFVCCMQGFGSQSRLRSVSRIEMLSNPLTEIPFDEYTLDFLDISFLDLFRTPLMKNTVSYRLNSGLWLIPKAYSSVSIGIIQSIFTAMLLFPSLRWNLKMMVSKRNLLFQGAIFRFHVKLWEGKQQHDESKKNKPSQNVSPSHLFDAQTDLLGGLILFLHESFCS